MLKGPNAKAWVSSALMSLVTLILILTYGESPDGPTLQDALTALMGALATGIASWYATWRVPNKPGETTLQAAPLAVLAAVGLALLLTACAPRHEMLVNHPTMIARDSCESLNGVLEVLGTLRAGGHLSDAQADRVLAVGEWAVPVCTGAPPTDGATLDELERVLDEMLLMQMEAQANE